MVKDYGAARGSSNYLHLKQIELVGSDKRVLDFGCYEGILAEALAERGCTVTGIEIDPRAAEVARGVCETVIVGDVEKMDLAEEVGGREFDVGVFGDVLEHLKDPPRVLRQMRQLLTPGGFVVVSVPNIAHASIRLMLLQGRFDYEDTGILDDTHLKYYTRESIGDLLEACGYMIEVMDWSEAKVPESRLREVLDPLGLTNLEEVVKVFSDWEATAFQYIIKAFPASEEDQVRRLSEEKVQAERRARELEAEVIELRKRDALVRELEELAEGLRMEIDRSGVHARGLETVISDKDTYIKTLEDLLAERSRDLTDREEQLAQLASRLQDLEGRLPRGKKPD